MRALLYGMAVLCMAVVFVMLLIVVYPGFPVRWGSFMFAVMAELWIIGMICFVVGRTMKEKR